MNQKLMETSIPVTYPTTEYKALQGLWKASADKERELRSQIKALKENGEKKEAAKIAKQLTAAEEQTKFLREQLQQQEQPERSAAWMMLQLVCYVEDGYQETSKTRNEVLAKMAQPNNLLHTLEWKLDDLIMAEAQRNYYLQIARIWKAREAKTLAEMMGTIEAVHEDLQARIRYHARRMNSRSTSVCGNLVEDLQVAGWANLMEDRFGDGYSHVKYYMERETVRNDEAEWIDQITLPHFPEMDAE